VNSILDRTGISGIASHIRDLFCCLTRYSPPCACEHRGFPLSIDANKWPSHDSPWRATSPAVLGEMKTNCCFRQHRYGPKVAPMVAADSGRLVKPKVFILSQRIFAERVILVVEAIFCVPLPRASGFRASGYASCKASFSKADCRPRRALDRMVTSMAAPVRGQDDGNAINLRQSLRDFD